MRFRSEWEIADARLKADEAQKTRPEVRKRVARYRARRIWSQLRADGWNSIAELREALDDAKKAYVPTWELPEHLREFRSQGSQKVKAEDLIPSRRIVELLEKNLCNK